MASESKKREVLQLFKEYRTFWTPFGGAMPLDETGVVDATYGPAGYIEAGMNYSKGQRGPLAESYEDLEHAITLAKREYFTHWVILLEAYFGSEPDPDVVRLWRERGSERIGYHDKFVEAVADNLRHTELYVVWPKRMSTREEKQVEKMNDEFYSIYKRLKSEGHKNRSAIQQAATMCGYSEPRGYEIVRVREGRAS
jgi:hypothetical protein